MLSLLRVFYWSVTLKDWVGLLKENTLLKNYVFPEQNEVGWKLCLPRTFFTSCKAALCGQSLRKQTLRIRCPICPGFHSTPGFVLSQHLLLKNKRNHKIFSFYAILRLISIGRSVRNAIFILLFLFQMFKGRKVFCGRTETWTKHSLFVTERAQTALRRAPPSCTLGDLFCSAIEQRNRVGHWELPGCLSLKPTVRSASCPSRTAVTALGF